MTQHASPIPGTSPLAGPFAGHVAAFATNLLWGTTFISTKVLLEHLLPIEILVTRFALGYAALWLIWPRRLAFQGLRTEGLMAAAGFCGIFLYYLLENIALTYTFASNVGVMVVTAPLFTAILQRLFCQEKERLGLLFGLGFVLAMAGTGLISFGGQSLVISPKGDALAMLAALSFAVYSLLMRRVTERVPSPVAATRRVFFYGLCFMLPSLFFFDTHMAPAVLLEPVCLANLLFLGLGASALCFVSWNFAIKQLGPVTTTLYIYLSPVVTVIAAVLLLDEPWTATLCLGTILTLAGLVLSRLDQFRHVRASMARTTQGR